MLRSGETGGVFVVESGAAPAARLGCGCLLLGLALMVPLFLAMAFLPPRQMTIDCDRARGNCTWAARTVPLGDVQGATTSESDRGGRSFRVYTLSLTLLLKSGEKDGVCTVPRDDAAAAALKADADKLSAFLADPNAQKVTVQCSEDVSTTGERVYYPIVSVVLLAIAIFLLPAVGRRRAEIDPGKKQVRLRGSIRSGVAKRDVPFGDVQSVEVKDRFLYLVLKSGERLELAQARVSDPVEPLAHARSRIEALLVA